MLNDEYLLIAEYAKIKGIGKNVIYRRLNTLFNLYVITTDNGKTALQKGVLEDEKINLFISRFLAERERTAREYIRNNENGSENGTEPEKQGENTGEKIENGSENSSDCTEELQNKKNASQNAGEPPAFSVVDIMEMQKQLAANAVKIEMLERQLEEEKARFEEERRRADEKEKALLQNLSRAFDTVQQLQLAAAVEAIPTEPADFRDVSGEESKHRKKGWFKGRFFGH